VGTQEQLVALAASYAVLIVMIVLGRRAYESIAAMVVVYALIAASPGSVVASLGRLAEWNDVRVFVFIFLSMLLAGLLKAVGLLDEMVRGASSLDCRAALAGVPALIGLMPMPGGALVSAIALRDRFREAGLTGEEATYVNYWFRHVWVPSWPLFQSIVITASVLYLDPLGVVRVTWPATLGAIVAGFLVSAPLLARARCRGAGSSLARFLASISPLIGLVVLFLAGAPLLFALAYVTGLVALFWRPPMDAWREALRLALKPTIHLVLFEALLFKNLILETQASQAIVEAAQTAGVPAWLVLYGVPFLLGLAAGGENFFAATAIPVLTGYIGLAASVDPLALATAYLGGFLGVMASPVHLCLALTLEYFEAKPGPVYKLILASILLSTLIGGGLVVFLYG